MPDSSQDLRNKILGRKGENLAVSYLKKHGYKIIKRNYKTPFGEADILAFKDGFYCFVEVKTRENSVYEMPIEAVDEKKRERYRKIAWYFCTYKREELPCRYDVAAIYKDGNKLSVDYFENAFE